MHQRGSDSGSDNRRRATEIASSGLTEPFRIGTSSGSEKLTTEEGGDRLRVTPEYAPEASPLEQAQNLYRLGKLMEAEKAYRALLVREPSGDAAAGLGAVLKKSGRKREAGEHYNWALNHCPWSPILLNNASSGFQPLHPTPLALVPLPPRPQWWDGVSREQAEGGGDDEAEE